MKLTLNLIGVAAIGTALSTTVVFAANSSVDVTVLQPLRAYTPTPADLAYTGVTPGDTAAADVFSVGTNLQYVGLALDGDGVNANSAFPFVKVQQQDGSGNFGTAACYLGNNGSAGSFGLGFFSLSQPFKKARMFAVRQGSTVTVLFTRVNGGALPDQSFTCDGAPAPVGSSVGIASYAKATAQLDNFASCKNLLDDFSYTGPLSASGNWNDVAPGMHANGSRALGGPSALSFWTPQVACSAR